MKYIYHVENKSLRQRIYEEHGRRQEVAARINEKVAKKERLKEITANILIGTLVSAVMVGIVLLAGWMDSL
ncbi:MULTISPECIES: hypothetical protein [Bacillus]|uniref:hypothetical protein n=1 Tax=Bacillus TaxID=1386 RepID=UPI000C77C216|nr:MULTISPECIES: hypothetical protein [Bacillus]MCP1161240.1 hypothetical protein [Bacillus infantis]PLR70562.1 hypothetical protein CYJ37_23825 [Bacillus sp. UMB0728]